MCDQSDTNSEKKGLILQNKREMVLSEIQLLASEVKEEARREKARSREEKQRLQQEEHRERKHWHKERAAKAFINFCRHGFGLDKKHLARLLENQEHFPVFLDFALKRATKNGFLHRLFYTPLGVLLIPVFGFGFILLSDEYAKETGDTGGTGFTDETMFVRSFGRFQKYDGSVDEFYQAVKEKLDN